MSYAAQELAFGKEVDRRVKEVLKNIKKEIKEKVEKLENSPAQFTEYNKGLNKAISIIDNELNR